MVEEMVRDGSVVIVEGVGVCEEEIDKLVKGEGMWMKEMCDEEKLGVYEKLG